MGLFSWFAATGRKSAVASSIEAYFDILKRNGLFDGNPSAVATRLVEEASDKVSGFTTGRYGRFVTASGVMAMALMDSSKTREVRGQYAIALAAMMKAALEVEPARGYTAAEVKILHGSQIALMQFDSEAPSFAYDLQPASPQPLRTEQPSDSKARARAMDELLRRMSERS